jgi:hypothetical protein
MRALRSQIASSRQRRDATPRKFLDSLLEMVLAQIQNARYSSKPSPIVASQSRISCAILALRFSSLVTAEAIFANPSSWRAIAAAAKTALAEADKCEPIPSPSSVGRRGQMRSGSRSRYARRFRGPGCWYSREFGRR